MWWFDLSDRAVISLQDTQTSLSVMSSIACHCKLVFLQSWVMNKPCCEAGLLSRKKQGVKAVTCLRFFFTLSISSFGILFGGIKCQTADFCFAWFAHWWFFHAEFFLNCYEMIMNLKLTECLKKKMKLLKLYKYIFWCSTTTDYNASC